MNLADLNKLNTMTLSTDLRDAIWFAMTKHQGQLRKGGEPFIPHCLRVMLRMETEKEMVVAVLHDVVEDTDTDIYEVSRLFGNDAAVPIIHLTHRFNQYLDETYFEYIRRAAKNEVSGKVKVADLIDNRSTLHQLPNQAEAASLDQRYTKALEILRGLGFPR